MLRTTGLESLSLNLGPTWESHDSHISATLDHILVTDRAMVSSYALKREVTCSDHQAVLCTLDGDTGCWNIGQHVPVVRQDRLNLTNIDNLAPLFCSELERQRDRCTDLASLEQCMWTSAQAVFGVQKAGGGKPFINKSTLALRKAIRVARRLLRLYSSRDDIGDPPCTQWQDLHDRLILAGCATHLDSLFGPESSLWQAMPRVATQTHL